MKYTFTFLTIAFLCVGIITSCSKEGTGMADPVGGNFPTNYIIINDSTFSPASITVVNGNSITFVNHSGVAKGLYSSDSIVINKQGIADNTSFYFKKDTTGTIIYRMAGKPSVKGTISITP